MSIVSDRVIASVMDKIDELKAAGHDWFIAEPLKGIKPTVNVMARYNYGDGGIGVYGAITVLEISYTSYARALQACKYLRRCFPNN